jgi:serine protease Do
VVRGWLGVYIQPANEALVNELDLPFIEGALVSEVTPDSPAEKAGIHKRDFITEFDGKKIADSNHLMHLIATYKPGSKIAVKLVRDGRNKILNVTLGERPDDEVSSVLTSSGDDTNRLGLAVSDLTEELAREFGLEKGTSGIVVTDVADGSVADKEGVQPGDIILEANRETVSRVREFNHIVDRARPGATVLLYLVRGEQKFFVALKAEND